MDDLLVAPQDTPPSGRSIDLDLGELTHAAAAETAMRDDARRGRRAGRESQSPARRTAVLLVTVALAGSAVGWQIGARDPNAGNGSARSRPAVLSWLVDNGPNLQSSVRDPSEDLQLHVANLGSQPVRVVSVVARTRQNPVDLQLMVVPQAPVTAGHTTEVVMVAHAACRSAYVGASLSVRLTGIGPGGSTQTTDIPVVEGGGVGVSFRDVLNRLCRHPVADAASGGLDGVYVQSTFTAELATLILDNRTAETRTVTFSALPSPAFELVASPAELVLPPGISRSVTLRGHVTSCRQLYSLGAWAETTQLVVRGPDPDESPTAPSVLPASYPLKGLLLATLGAAVQKACGTSVG